MARLRIEVATGLDQKNQPVRLATFRSVMRKECLQIFRILILALVSYYFFSTQSTGGLLSRQAKSGLRKVSANSCCETPYETVDCFVNRPRKLASSCQFGALTEEMTRDRFVIGIQDKNKKARMLQKGALSLDKALDACK